ncbi:MAG: nucleoid-associated protein [Actinomycetota bacterium]
MRTVFAFFRKKLTGVMGSKSLFIEQNPLTIGDLALETVISAVKKINNDAQTFVVESQKIAQRLWDTQDRRNPAGLLVVARGQIEARPCVGILKLEHEHGVQAEESSDDHGNFVYQNNSP